jgi:hypothetical protein
MTYSLFLPSRLAAGIVSFGALMSVLPAATAESPAAATHRQERAACLADTSHQDQATCLREADAARTEARRGGLTTADAEVLSQNAGKRCQAQPAGAARTACLRMAAGEGTASGSVADGGRLRTLTSRSAEPPSTPLPRQ